MAITYAYDATEDNIRRVLDNEKVSLTPKNDVMDFDRRERLLQMDDIEKDILFYSSITGPLNGLSTGSWGRRKLDNGNTKFSWINTDGINLLSSAFQGEYPYYLRRRNRRRFSVSDSLMKKLSVNFNKFSDVYEKLKWYKKYTFSYEIESPIEDMEKIGSIMQQELNTFFRAKYGIEAVVEKREVPCLMLTTLDTKPVFKTKGGKASRASNPEENYEITNMPMSIFINALLVYFSEYPLPIVNETGYKGNVDLLIKGGIKDDVDYMNQKLQKYGLVLKEELKKINMLIFRQLDENNQPIGYPEKPFLK